MIDDKNPCADCGWDMPNDDITCENCKTKEDSEALENV